ncbi:DNA repair protein rad51 [Pleurostoma richardsiae]|uniref:DNA repair protein rad51 n=1 Tax=Pleurostoma richardsiae TaxID=41990 RepID=A0AA38RS31_9PEZI|nr:DNA repair protein rad51 [Pleurostoma richardsiae]
MDLEQAFLYKETRLNLEPASAASIVHIRLPSSTSQPRSSQRRPITTDKYAGEEEKAYRLKNLAKSSSLYHRRHHASPRSFLWRVLEENTVLSVRAVDVCKKQNDSDSNIILHFHFPHPIRPSCVALADPEEKDTLNIFVLDQTNHFYSLSLRPDHFRKRSATDSGLGDACKIHLSSTFSFKHPHRLIAASADQVVVTLHDGGLVRFDRIKRQEVGGALWKDVIYTAAGWAKGLQSLLPFRGGQTIRHGKVNLELSAATSVAVDSMRLGNASFLYTVCLDHRLRIWNVLTGQILYTGDMLNVERNPQDLGKWIIEPTQSSLVRIAGHAEGKRLLATYSPVGAGEFKFWKVETDNESTIYVHDLFPDKALVPPTPSSSDVWTLADFAVAQHEGPAIHLWTLWKNNISYRVQKLEFSLQLNVERWQRGWIGVHIESSSPAAETSGPCDPTDSTEKWLELIFHPGRYSKATLETALAMYERGLGTAKDVSNRGSKGLAESICSVLGSTATLDKSSSGVMDYEQFRATSEIQWRRFYRLVVELDKQRGEALSLALDTDRGMVWVLCADLIAAMPQCTALDQIYFNLRRRYDPIATLISTGFSFVENFSDAVMQQSKAALRPELFEDSAKTDYECIQYFFDKSGFWRQVSDEDASQVVEVLGKDFRLVNSELYQNMLSLLDSTEDARNRDIRLPLTEFGRKLVVKSVQQTARIRQLILFSQLILLVHMEDEVEQERAALHTRLDIGTVYRRLIAALKRLELIIWLVKTEITVPFLNTERPPSFGSSPVASKRGDDDTQVITAFEGNVSHLLGLVDVNGEPLALSLSDVVDDICAPDSTIELSPALIQCSLLKRDRPDLALELSPFCEQAPFPTYVQGRVFLALRDYTTAAGYFRKAAVGMSVPMKHADRHSSGLLDDTEWKLLNSGLSNYYSHIVALFEKPKAYSYIVSFAHLSLQFAQGPDSNPVRTEMLSRLFTASTSISSFEQAHATLLSMADHALQRSCLKKLVERMCEASQATELVELPFSGLQDEVDDILLQKCRLSNEVVRGTPYHKILYAWRIHHNNYRGAAAILYDRLQKLRRGGLGEKLTGDDVLDTPVTQQYLSLINTLCCVDPKQAWITVEELPTNDPEVQKRKVVTLTDIRREYQDELDRIAAIQNNQFGFTAEEEAAEGP